MREVGHILVTGASGFLGRHLVPLLEKKFSASRISAIDSAAYDLMSVDQVRQAFDEYKPDTVVHLAAYSGGIGANRAYPADFYFRNTILTANMFEVAAERKIGKLIYPMGGCSYPSTANSPISEGQMWQGYPQAESAGYSSAKKMGIVASQAYQDQYGLASTVVIPGNMYGEYDNFRTAESHVVPAMIRRYYECKLRGDKEIVMWGSGAPQRDFVYAGDVAKAMIWFVENYDETGPVNLSSGTTTPIRQLAETIKDLMQYEGEIKWDTDKPDGQMVKIFDVTRMHDLGLRADTSLHDGLRNTIEWFARNYEGHGDRLRL